MKTYLISYMKHNDEYGLVELWSILKLLFWFLRVGIHCYSILITVGVDGVYQDRRDGYNADYILFDETVLEE